MPKNILNHIDYSNLELNHINTGIDWFNVSAVFLCVCLIIIGRKFNPDSFQTIFKPSNNRSSNGISTILLITNFIITMSLFLWRAYSINYSNEHSISLFFLILFSIIGVLLLKIGIIYFIDVLFKRNNHFHITLHLKFYQLIGLVLLPIYILTYFLEQTNLNRAYILALIIFICLIIFRESKALFTALNNRISLLYIILYLCTLELLPIVLSFKIFG